jgi:hypothetical protein
VGRVRRPRRAGPHGRAAVRRADTGPRVRRRGGPGAVAAGRHAAGLPGRARPDRGRQPQRADHDQRQHPVVVVVVIIVIIEQQQQVRPAAAAAAAGGGGLRQHGGAVRAARQHRLDRQCRRQSLRRAGGVAALVTVTVIVIGIVIGIVIVQQWIEASA